MSKPPEKYTCDHCHQEFPGRPSLELSAWDYHRKNQRSVWDLCSQCILDLIKWIEATDG